jgi:hypothetical protein
MVHSPYRRGETSVIDEQRLNDFDPQVRRRTLEALVEQAQVGEIPLDPGLEAVNMHCHTFFSFNGYGYSPTALAWLGRRKGFQAMGIVDFDVLDGADEFLQACDLVGLRGSVGLETRVYVPEFATREINSPGEPGVCYQMGIGFTGNAATGHAAEILADLRQRAESRNLGLLERVNAHMQPVAVDYVRDVQPLTPKGNATERHMLTAYVAVAERVYPIREERVRFWADRLDLQAARVEAMIDDVPNFKNAIRSKLMKQGGVGYVQPGPDTFPSVDQLHEMVVLLGALPCFTWLDGTSEGEQAIEELLGLMVAKGAVAVNVIPDRNWNIRDAEEKRVKVRNLYEIVRLAEEMDLPVNVGTELNRSGLKLVDDFDAPELAPVRQAFLDGAMFIYGHTVAQRALGIGYQSAWAARHLPSRRERNAFYLALGRRVPPGRAGLQRLRGVKMGPPQELLAEF